MFHFFRGGGGLACRGVKFRPPLPKIPIFFPFLHFIFMHYFQIVSSYIIIMKWKEYREIEPFLEIY